MPHRLDHPESYDSSFSDLIKELVGEISLLIRKEIALARVEMTEKLSAMAKASAMLSAAAFIGLFALGAITAGMILAINVALPGWAAALIVAGFYLVIAGILVGVGIGRLRTAGRPVPEQTIETIKEDVSWAKRQARSATT